jgi:hypothetical protein
MSAISVTTAYGVALLGLVSIGLVIGAAEPVGWYSVAGLALVGFAGSTWAGMLARHSMVLIPPLGLAGLFLALAVMVMSGGPGDGGPAAVAAVCLVAMAIVGALALAAGLGVVISRYLANPPAPEESDDTH